MKISKALLAVALSLCASSALSQSVVSVTADQIASDFSDNALKANKKYANKPLHISGTVDGILESGSGYSVELDAKGTMLGISVKVLGSALDAVADLNKGDYVTMYCMNLVDSMVFRCEGGYVVK
jgi:hypothetical protein